MSKRYFVTYDLDKPGQNYHAVKQGIVQSCNWYLHLQGSVYFIVSNLSTRQIYDRIRRYIDVNDKLTVIEASDAVVDGLNTFSKPAFLNMWRYGTPTPASVA